MGTKGSLPVVDEGERLIGIVTDRDVAVRVVSRGLDSDTTVVGDVASRDVAALTPEHDLDDANDPSRQGSRMPGGPILVTPKTSYSDHHGDMEQDQADPRVVQQLMFNRILSQVRLLSVEGVTLVGFDSKTGTLVCSLAGVNVVVSVSPDQSAPAAG